MESCGLRPLADWVKKEMPNFSRVRRDTLIQAVANRAASGRWRIDQHLCGCFRRAVRIGCISQNRPSAWRIGRPKRAISKPKYNFRGILRVALIQRSGLSCGLRPMGDLSIRSSFRTVVRRKPRKSISRKFNIDLFHCYSDKKRKENEVAALYCSHHAHCMCY